MFLYNHKRNPIEYYGINENTNKEKEVKNTLKIEELLFVEKDIYKILRVYGNIELKLDIIGENIINENVRYILIYLICTIEYTTLSNKEDFSKDETINIHCENFPMFFSVYGSDKDIDNILRLSELYVKCYDNNKIYIYSSIKVY